MGHPALPYKSMPSNRLPFLFFGTLPCTMGRSVTSSDCIQTMCQSGSKQAVLFTSLMGMPHFLRYFTASTEAS
jgi:hypothetical protein